MSVNISILVYRAIDESDDFNLSLVYYANESTDNNNNNQ